MGLSKKLLPRSRTTDRTRQNRLARPSWFRPKLVELESRIVPATTYGTLNTIDSNFSIAELVDDDVVMVEIESDSSFDTFRLNDGQLAGKLELSFINGYAPALGDSFAVLTSTQPLLVDDFAAYEGLGFFDGLYLMPIVEGNTLSLEVAQIPGGDLSATVLDVVAAFANGTVSLSVPAPGVFAVMISNANASAELEISADEFVVKSASITIPKTFQIGSLFEVEEPTVTIEDFAVSAAGLATGTFSIGAASATLFPGKPFSASVTDFQFTFDTNTSAFDITVGEFELTVGEAVVVTATAAEFTYNPETIDVPGTEIGTVESLSITIPKLAGFTGTIEDLVIRNNGFAFESATVAVSGTFSIGSIAEVINPFLTITGVDVTFSDPEPFTGSLTLGVDTFTLFPGNSKFTAEATELSATFDFSDDKNGAMTLTAAAVKVTLNPIIEFTVGDVTIDASAEGTDPIITVGQVDVNLKSVGITGTGGPFQIQADGEFVALNDFGVSLTLNTAEPGALKWPKWLPIQITTIGLNWPDVNTDPNDFTIGFSATVNTASIGPTGGLPLTVQGGVDNVVIDVNKLAGGVEFPIVSMDGGLLSVEGMLFGFEIDGTIVFGIVRADQEGNLIDDERRLLDEDCLPTSGDTSTFDPENDTTIFYGGLEAGITLAGKGFELKIGMSELGPLSMFIAANVPVILEPVSGLAISGFRGEISFGNPIPSITDAEELADSEFAPPGDLTALQWQCQLKHQVANQVENTVTWADFGSVFDNPENIRISAGASLYSAYATTTSFHADVDITADLSGKFIFNAAGKLANDGIDLNFRAYVDLSEVDQGSATILFLTNVMPIQDGNETSSPIAVYGGVEFHFFDDSGEEITDPDEDSASEQIQLIINGGAKFKAPFKGAGFFSATLTGTVTVDFDIQETELEFDMNGTLSATYLGNLAQAAGHFTIDFDGGNIPALGEENIPIIYGAIELTSGDAFDKLEQIGIVANAKGWFYINTDTIQHDVELTFADDSTKVIELSPLSAGLGADGTLTWLLRIPGLPTQNWFTMVGLLDLNVSASDGAELFVNATLLVGATGAEILTLHAQGLLIANATGVAGKVELTREETRGDVFGVGVGTAFSSNTSFVMVFNTTSQDQTYTLPPGITIPGQSSTVTVPGGPPPAGTPGTATTWNETSSGFYFLVHVHGDLSYLNGSVSVSGDFNMLITSSSIAMRMDASLLVFGTSMTLAGNASISATNFTCDVTATVSALYPASSFEITGTFSFHVNTANSEYWVAVTNARVNLFGLVMTGGFKIGIENGAFSITIPSTTPLSLNFFSIVTFSVSGSLSTSGSFSFTASASMAYNYTDAQRNASTEDLDVGVSGSVSVSISNSGFSGSFFGGVQAYGEIVASVAGSLAITDSQVVLSFTVFITITPEFTVDPPTIDIYYPDPTWDDPFRWSLAYSYDPPPFTVPALKADVSFDLTLGGVSAPKAPPPPPLTLARLGTAPGTTSVLYLNLGVDAFRRLQFTTDNGESFTISHSSGSVGNETVTVTAFGQTLTYPGVSKIVATDAGAGDDVIKIQSGVLADVELHGGLGADNLSYLGSGSATLYGDGGTDMLTSGGGNDTLYGGIGNDQLNGGAGSDTLHGEGGDDRLQGVGGNDFLYGGADNDVLRGGDDNDHLEGGLGSDQIFGESGNDAIFWTVGDGSDTRTDGGLGSDTFTITGTPSAETVAVGAAADGHSFTVIFAGTVHTGGTGIDNLVLDMQGGADSVTINDTSSTLFQNLSHTTLKLGNDSSADSVTVNASAGVDTFYLSATSSVVSIDRGVAVVNGSAVRLGLSTSIEQAAATGGADTLLLNLDAGDDIAIVKGTLLATTINGGTQRTQIRVGTQADTNTGTLNSIVGQLVVNAGGGSEDALYLHDKTDTTANTGTLTPTTITGLGMGTNGITYTGFESLDLNLGSGGNTFTIQDTFTSSTTLNSGSGFDTVNIQAVHGLTTVNTEAGHDTINVGSLAPATGGTVNQIAAALIVTGGDANPDTLNVDDTGDAAANTGVLTATQLTGLGMGGGITYGAIELLNISLGAGGNSFNVQATAAGTATTLNSGNGNDTLTVDSNGTLVNGTVDGILSSLAINGQGGFSVLTLEDYSDTTGDPVHVTPTQIGAAEGDTFFGLGGFLTFSELDQVTLNMSQAYLPDTIYLTPSSTEFFIRARDPQTPMQRAQLLGDALYLDFTGLTANQRQGVRLNASGVNDPVDPVLNTWNIPGHGRVNYKQIEKMNHVQTLAIAPPLSGNKPRLRVIDAETGVQKLPLLNGVHVAVGDVNGDAIPDIITSGGPGGGTKVRVYNGATGIQFPKPLGVFAAFPSASKTTVNVAVGDFNLDGLADIVTGSASGGDSTVKVFDAYKLQTRQANPVVSQFFAYDRRFPGGAQLAVGDLTGDGIPDIATGPDAGANAEVRVFETTLSADQATVAHTLLTSISAFPSYNAGVSLAVGDVTGDGRADIVVGMASGETSRMRIYDGATINPGLAPTLLLDSAPYGAQSGGVRVALVDVDGDGVNELITSSALIRGRVKPAAFDFLPNGLDGLTPAVLDTYFARYASDPFFQGALFLAGGN